MFGKMIVIRRIVGALAITAVLIAAPAEAAGSGPPATPGVWESLITWLGVWTGMGPVLTVVFSASDAGPMIDPLGGSGPASVNPNSGPPIEPMGVGSTSSQ